MLREPKLHCKLAEELLVFSLQGWIGSSSWNLLQDSSDFQVSGMSALDWCLSYHVSCMNEPSQLKWRVSLTTPTGHTGVVLYLPTFFMCESSPSFFFHVGEELSFSFFTDRKTKPRHLSPWPQYSVYPAALPWGISITAPVPRRRVMLCMSFSKLLASWRFFRELK